MWLICRIIHEVILSWNIVKVCHVSARMIEQSRKATCFWTEPGLTGSLKLKTSYSEMQSISTRQLPHVCNVFYNAKLFFFLNFHWAEVSSCMLHILLPQLLITLNKNFRFWQEDKFFSEGSCRHVSAALTSCDLQEAPKHKLCLIIDPTILQEKDKFLLCSHHYWWISFSKLLGVT